MTFVVDSQELKPGLIIFRRADTQHRRWYCRIKVPKEDRYKTVSLKTSDINEARDRAYDHDAELRFKIKHEMPLFSRLFSQVAKEYSDFHKERADAGQISHHRWRVLDSHIRSQLNNYVGDKQISLIGADKWTEYPIWRQRTGKGRSSDTVSNGTIRSEMDTFRCIMGFAAKKSYILDSHVFKGKLPVSKARREEFTPQEYRRLHTFARKWITQARRKHDSWSRTVAYNFLLIMTNTGMRPSEAKNLRWGDVGRQKDPQGREFLRLAVRGKGKHRHLVAGINVATYFERIREISNATEPDDFVFTVEGGQRTKTLYHSLIEKLLIESGLQMTSSGSRRSTYCFRHTYATFRLTEGVDVYFLAKQMGTSVKMIEDHYGHVNPVKNADRILLGLPGWEPAGAGSIVPSDSVNADAEGTTSPKSSRKARSKRGS